MARRSVNLLNISILLDCIGLGLKRIEISTGGIFMIPVSCFPLSRLFNVSLSILGVEVLIVDKNSLKMRLREINDWVRKNYNNRF